MSAAGIPFSFFAFPVLMNQRYLESLPFLLLALGFVVLQGLGFDGLFGQDPYAYLGLGKSLSLYFQGAGPKPFSHYPAGFALVPALISLLGVPILWAFRLLVLLCGLGVLYLLRRFLLDLYPFERTRITVFLCLVVLAPAFVKGSLVVLSDVPAAFLVLASVWFLYRFWIDAHTENLMLSALGSGLAWTFRDGVLPLCLVSGFVLLVLGFRSGKPVFALLSLVSGLSLAFSIRSLAGMPDFNSHPYSSAWSFANFFAGSFHTADGHRTAEWPNLFFWTSVFWHRSFLLPGLVLSLAALFSGAWKRPFFGLLLAVCGMYILFLAGLPVQNHRYLLVIFPFVVLLLFPGFLWCWELLRERKWALIPAVLVFPAQVLLAARAMAKPLQFNALERELAADLQSYSQQTIYSFSVDIALRERLPEVKWVSLWERSYSEFPGSAFVLFNEAEFANEWKGQNPMNNFDRLKASGRLQVLKTWPSGWTLYAIR